MRGQVGDLFQGQAAIDKTRGTGMAKGVRSSWANGRPQGLPVMPDDFKDSAAGKRAEGAAQRQKDLAKYCVRSYLSKVTQHVDRNSSAQREDPAAASLAAPQVQTDLFPIDVFEAQRPT